LISERRRVDFSAVLSTFACTRQAIQFRDVTFIDITIFRSKLSEQVRDSRCSSGYRIVASSFLFKRRGDTEVPYFVRLQRPKADYTTPG